MLETGMEEWPGELLFGAEKAYPWHGLEPLNRTLAPGWERTQNWKPSHIGTASEGRAQFYFRPWTGIGNEHFRPITNPDHPQFRKKDGSRGNPKHLIPIG